MIPLKNIMKITDLSKLLFLSSLVFGFYLHGFYTSLLSVEIFLLKDLFNVGNSLLNQLNILLLVLFQALMIWMIFIKDLGLFKKLVIIVPLALLLLSITNMFILIISEPQILVTFVPYMAIWIYILLTLHKNRKVNNA